MSGHVAELVLGLGFDLRHLTCLEPVESEIVLTTEKKSVDKNPKLVFKRDIDRDQGFPVLTILLHHCMTEREPEL